MAEKKEILAFQVKIVKEGKLNAAAAELAIDTICQSVANCEISWQQLGTTAEEMEAIFERILLREFVDLCTMFKAGQAQLDDFEYYFPFVKRWIIKDKIVFARLAPFKPGDFLYLQSHFRKKRESAAST